MQPIIFTPAQVRGLSIGGLVLNSLITLGGVGLWKKKHHVWGAALVLIGGSALAGNVAGMVSGQPTLNGRF